MKKNYLKNNYLIKTTAKKIAKKTHAKKKADARAKKVEKILEMVRGMCDYAMDNLMVEPSHWEELEYELYKMVK